MKSDARSAAALLTAALLLASCTTPNREPRPSVVGSSSTPPVSSAPAPSRSPSVVVTSQRISIELPANGSFLVRGAYPHQESRCRHARQPFLLARYPGSLTVDRAKDGTLSVTVTLPFERYLEGIAEVPASWPRAALEAQAIAARSYALATTGWTGQGATLASPICSTTSCQVYRGIPVPPQPGIGRWYAAVRRTAGQMLLFGGRPAETVYFSTSNGRTYGNEDVFGSAPLPYLRPVIERDDGASPESHWRVTLPYRDLSTILVGAGLWSAGTPVRRVALTGGTFHVTGPGTERSIPSSDFRAGVNAWAPCLLPGRYPPDSRFGSALPTTVPSGWLAASTTAKALILTGRGWGHGVGMVQWGADGKASRGWSAARILSYYYGGLVPELYPEPGVIDVQVASGLTSLHILPSGAGARLNGQPLGRGPIVILGGDLLTASAG